MSSPDNLIAEMKKRMESSLNTLHHHLKGLRTGRASVNLLDSVMVEAYGDRLPINQVASVSTPDARTLSVQVWDKGMVKAVEKGIVAAELGLNPSADGTLIRISLPPLSEERRKELVKVGHKYGEEARVAIRNIRRDSMDSLKKMEKDKVISEDQHKNLSEQVQKVTDDFIKQIDQIIANKEKEITTI
ncbi:MAG: ribosome recycling factor [Sphingobacteriia bacterium]|nr:ribosome recycling factor [Sphingobacteriia bacterium]